MTLPTRSGLLGHYTQEPETNTKTTCQLDKSAHAFARLSLHESTKEEPMGSGKRPRNTRPSRTIGLGPKGIPPPINCPGVVEDVELRTLTDLNVGQSGSLKNTGYGVAFVIDAEELGGFIEGPHAVQLRRCLDVGLEYEGIVTKAGGARAWVRVTEA